MNKRVWIIFQVWVLAAAASGTLTAQPTKHVMGDGTTVTFPPLTITGSELAADVTYDVARGVYRYTYTITTPVTNQAKVSALHIDVAGRTARTQSDRIRRCARMSAVLASTNRPPPFRSVSPFPILRSGAAVSGRAVTSS